MAWAARFAFPGAISEDISETKDLAKEMPERATKMRKRLDKWLKDSGAKLPRPR